MPPNLESRQSSGKLRSDPRTGLEDASSGHRRHTPNGGPALHVGPKRPERWHDIWVLGPAARLRVPPNADAGTIRAAFGRQVRAVHPDIVGARRTDAAAEVAALIDARDRLLAGSNAALVPQTVVFFQHNNLAGALRALLHRRKQTRRKLC